MCIPASTLKILTSLAALEELGPSYRFRTAFYLDPFYNLKMKGYGDPLLLSEVLEGMSHLLSSRVRTFQSLILDTTYFAPGIVIPGSDGSTNPYDAPVGAISANFNTVAFRRDKQGRIVSAERETPLVPFACDRIAALGLAPGRHTFLEDSRGAAHYAGELLLHFLRQDGVTCNGSIRLGTVGPDDRLIYVHESDFPLETVVRKMMRSSSNFMANQILLSLGASAFGPPADLTKGTDAVSDYAEKRLGLRRLKMVEGSGLSRENRLSALDMLAVLKRFKPYRRLLREKGHVYYKTGTLKGISTRAGYINDGLGKFYYFVIFFNQHPYRMKAALNCVEKTVARQR
jgi:serine-type D-Ala-D-Ala carboxypeptidase/endopeptidase (penicillin-binding protein 4)